MNKASVVVKHPEKKTRDSHVKAVYADIYPMMAREYTAVQRAKLREFERELYAGKEIIHSYNRYLDKIAEYLKVPVEYLLNPVSAGSKNEYSLRENQLIEQCRRLAEDKKIEIERKMGYLASLQEFENEQ